MPNVSQTALQKIAINISGGHFMTAIKSANVNARIDQNVKKEAEAILTRIGLPRSVAIDMFYRQIILRGGIPFPVTIPQDKLPARDSMSIADFNSLMETGLKQAKENDSHDFDAVFEDSESTQ